MDESEYGRDESKDRGDLLPHERVVFFSDAVFAIAMTLLAIELRLPGAELIERIGADEAWNETVSLFIAYVISFIVTAVYWVGHMSTWKLITRTTGKLVWCSVLQLMFVAMMPFATRLYSEAFMGHGPGRFAFYAFVLSGISFFASLTRWVAIKQENLRERLGETEVRWQLVRGLIPLFVFASCIPLAFVLPVWTGGFIFWSIYPLTMIARRFFFRPAKTEPAA
ncbi:MAG: TMEM175 family protein [Pseudoxanthomonas sp.]